MIQDYHEFDVYVNGEHLLYRGENPADAMRKVLACINKVSCLEVIITKYNHTGAVWSHTITYGSVPADSAGANVSSKP